MIKGNEREKLTSKAILSKVDDYNIIRHFLGQDFDFKKKFHSPFRKDREPNLCFFPGNDGRILFKDFATGVSGDCFNFVSKLNHDENHNDVLMRIDREMGLGIQSKPVFTIKLVKKPDSIHKQAKLIQVVTKPFSTWDIDYWNSFEIYVPELLNKNVHSVKELYLNKQFIPNPYKELRFAYLFDDYLKIYSPFSKDFKWMSSTPNDYISGFDDIKHKVKFGLQDKILIISKSVKDELILKKFFKDVCSTQNESFAAINEENMQWILRGYEPKNVYIAYDSDNAGVQASKYFSESYGFNWINTPQIFQREGIKDFADLVKHKGLDTLENYLKIKKLI